MAYVVARRNGRFEVRESLHTPDGPRARSLAGFDVLTDEVLAKAARRARRPFDVEAVLASGRRAGAPVATMTGTGYLSENPSARAPGAAEEGSRGFRIAPKRQALDSNRRFVEASRRMALTLQRPPTVRPADPGAAS